MDPRTKKRLLILVATAATTSACGTALALNGNTHVTSCACQITDDFTSAARSSAQAWDAGTYAVVSTSTAMTAYVQVAGHLKITGENAVFVVTSTTPVDSAGNSLVGAPEDLLETYWTAYDQVLAGTSRDNPTIVTAIALPDLPSSFGSSTDDQVSSAVWEDQPAQAVLMDEGEVMTIHFHDGSWAEFKVHWDDQNHFHLIWNQNAWNADQKPINRDGTLKPNPNTSGTGTGSITAPGFGSGADYTWQFTGDPLCTWEQVLTIDGVPSAPFYSVGPC